MFRGFSESLGNVVGTLPGPSAELSLFLTSIGPVSFHSPFLQTVPLIRCPHSIHIAQRLHPGHLEVFESFNLSSSMASHILWAWIFSAI